MSDTIKWEPIGYGGVCAVHDQGDFTGALITTARAVQGGNNLWTPSVFQYEKQRPKKLGQGRITSKCTLGYYPGQVRTKEEAVRLCERKWEELLTLTQTAD